MDYQIVHVVAPERVAPSGNPTNEPDLGSVKIHNGGATIVLSLELNGFKWWRAMVEGTIPELKAWRDGAANRIGWLASDAPDSTDINRLANGINTAINAVGTFPFWVVAPRIGLDENGVDLGPDLSDPTFPLTVTAFKAVIDYGQFKDGWILWDVDVTGNLTGWRDADPRRHGWANSSPPKGPFKTAFINAITTAANNTQRFAGVETAP